MCVCGYCFLLYLLFSLLCPLLWHKEKVWVSSEQEMGLWWLSLTVDFIQWGNIQEISKTRLSMGVSVFPEYELGWGKESFLNVGGTIYRWGEGVLVVGDGNVGVYPHRIKVKGRTCEHRRSLSAALHPGRESLCCCIRPAPMMGWKKCPKVWSGIHFLPKLLMSGLLLQWIEELTGYFEIVI